MKFFSNKDVAKILRSIAAAYSVKGGQYFKIMAYEKAADSVEHATSELKDLWDDGKMDTVAGLGKNIQSYLGELFRTGRVKHFESVKKDLPKGMFAFLDISGIGPKTAYKLAKELKLKSVRDLESFAKAGKIRELEGFGKRSELDILASISEFKRRSQRHLLPSAFAIAQRMIEYLEAKGDCEKVEPLGSLRRMVATVGDIDIGAASKSSDKVIEHFKNFREVSRVLTSGEKASSVVLKNGAQVDLKVLPFKSYGSLLQHFTGSKNHNIHLREIALKKGMSLSEYGIKVKGRLRSYDNENDFYRALGMQYIEPELREDSGEIEQAVSHKLPKLVKLLDIRGDVHLHSSYPVEPSHDLGENSFEEIIKKAKSLNYEYIGFSDHSPGYSTHSKKQIVELIKQRTEKIEHIKASEKSLRILNLLEIDILANGELSVPDDALRLLDGAIAGIHSSHSQDKLTITNRLLTAINCKYVRIISHPTGRLLQQREAYEADWPRIFKECAKTGTLLEINAWPSRLDLSDVLVRDAVKFGVLLIINSDSHALAHMDNMKFGVAVARRGWAEVSDIANTRRWVEFRKLLDV